MLHVSAPDRAAFEVRVKTAMALDGMLRIKGLVRIDGRSAPLAVQAVGPRVETWFVPNATRRPGLVVIGMKSLDRAAVEAALRAAFDD